MKKKILTIIVVLFSTMLLFSEDMPLGTRWYYENGVTLNGKKFKYVSDTYREQLGWLYFPDGERNHCFLYDTYTYHDGNGEDLLYKYLPAWLEGEGFSIDWSKSKKENNGDYITYQVTDLMKERNCDVAVYILIGNWVLVVNYDKSTDSYWKFYYKINK